MAMEQHLEQLRKRHTEIDLQLMAENARPLPDSNRVRQLKHQKLCLKDDISRLAYQAEAA